MPDLLTIILNWRTAEMTLRAAEAAVTAMAGIKGGIVIVDNDSQDGSFEAMTAQVRARGWDTGPCALRVIQSGHNGGFGAGNNVGIRAGLPGGARPDYVYLLNSDAFPAPGAIRALLDHLETHPATGIAGGSIEGADDSVHHSAFRFPSLAGELEQAARFGPVSRLLRHAIVAAPMPDRTGPVDWLAGASMMIRQSVLDRIGLFDETFFLYFEETELCLRAARAGWFADYVRESHTMHIGSVSTGMKTWNRIPGFWLDSRLYYFRKSGGVVYAAAATLAHIAGGLIWRARAVIQRRDFIDPPYYLSDMTGHALRALVRRQPTRGLPVPRPAE